MNRWFERQMLHAYAPEVARARPLGEVVTEYNSLRRVAGSKPRAPETNQGARLKRKGTTRQVKAAICNSRGTSCWSVSRVGMERHRDGRPHGWFDARAPRLLSKPGRRALSTRLRYHGEQSRWQRIGLRNGTASRIVEPAIDPF